MNTEKRERDGILALTYPTVSNDRPFLLALERKIVIREFTVRRRFAVTPTSVRKLTPGSCSRDVGQRSSCPKYRSDFLTLTFSRRPRHDSLLGHEFQFRQNLSHCKRQIHRVEVKCLDIVSNEMFHRFHGKTNSVTMCFECV